MASKKTTSAASSETADPGTDVGVYTDEEMDAELVAATANRTAAYVTERGFGPNSIELVQYIAARALDSRDLNVVILEQLSERLLHAQSPADILTPFEPTKGEEYHGKTVEILSTEFLESDFAEGFPWYVSLQIRESATGPTSAITIGGEKLVMQCAAMDRLDMWPAVVRIHRADTPTKSGFYPLELRPPV